MGVGLMFDCEGGVEGAGGAADNIVMVERVV
jgi:hypothetical protein